MKNQVIKVLKKAHSISPLWLVSLYTPVVYFFRHLQTFYLIKFLVEGEERESGRSLKMVFFGKDSRILSYWTGILFRGNPLITKTNQLAIWNIENYMTNNPDRIDLIIVEITKLTRSFINIQKGFILPRWFNTLIDVENSLNGIMKGNTPRQINKYEFYCEEKFSTDDLKFFYDRMFKPYIQTRHNDSSVMVDFSYFLKRFRKKDSRLFFLMKDKEPMAASFNERKNGMIKFSGLGVLDAKREILSMDAIRALYYFMFLEYKKENEQIINFGGTSPLLSDGLTQFKSSLRAYPNRENTFGEKSLWVIPLHKKNEIHPVLKSNPFVYISKNKINRAVFVDTGEFRNKQDFLQLIKKIRYEKVDCTKIFCLDNSNDLIKWINEETLQNLDVVKLEN